MAATILLNMAATILSNIAATILSNMAKQFCQIWPNNLHGEQNHVKWNLKINVKIDNVNAVEIRER